MQAPSAYNEAFSGPPEVTHRGTEATSMFHAISHLALFAQLAVSSTVPESSAPSMVPFDTTISVARLAGVALSL
jgi:hypothetical protein